MSMTWLKQYLLRQKHNVAVLMKLVVVQGSTLGFVEPTVTGQVALISGESQYGYIDNKKIYAGNPKFKIAAGAISNQCRLNVDYIGTFNPTAQKTLIDKDNKYAPLRENDQCVVSTPGQSTVFPWGACIFVATVKIENAGQDNTYMG